MEEEVDDAFDEVSSLSIFDSLNFKLLFEAAIFGVADFDLTFVFSESLLVSLNFLFKFFLLEELASSILLLNNVFVELFDAIAFKTLLSIEIFELLGRSPIKPLQFDAPHLHAAFSLLKQSKL